MSEIPIDKMPNPDLAIASTMAQPFVAKNEEKIEQYDIDALHQENPGEDKKESKNQLYDDLRKHLPLKGAYLTALGHSFTSLLYLFNSKFKEKSDTASLFLSKLILSANCLIQTKEASNKNRIWEAISRFLEPLFIIAEKRVEDLGLARGIGLGISQLVEAQDGIREELIKQNDLDKEKISMGADHDLNWKACKKITSELIRGGFGSKRRFMTGFSSKNIKKEFTAFRSKFHFGSMKHLFDRSEKDERKRIVNFFNASGLSHIKTLCAGDKNKDKGHTTALSGYLMIVGSLIGYMDKASKGMLYKVGGTLRNIGGMVADVSIFGFPDPKHNMASPWLTVNGILDIAQRFIPETMTSAIKAIGNVSMAAYNVGVAIYLNRSSDKTNEEDKISRYDTDLATAA